MGQRPWVSYELYFGKISLSLSYQFSDKKYCFRSVLVWETSGDFHSLLMKMVKFSHFSLHLSNIKCWNFRRWSFCDLLHRCFAAHRKTALLPRDDTWAVHKQRINQSSCCSSSFKRRCDCSTTFNRMRCVFILFNDCCHSVLSSEIILKPAAMGLLLEFMEWRSMHWFDIKHNCYWSSQQLRTLLHVRR